MNRLRGQDSMGEPRRSDNRKREPEDQDRMPEDAMARTAYGLWALDAFKAEQEEFEACCARTDHLRARNDPTGDPERWLQREIQAMERAIASKKKQEGEMPDA